MGLLVFLTFIVHHYSLFMPRELICMGDSRGLACCLISYNRPLMANVRNVTAKQGKQRDSFYSLVANALQITAIEFTRTICGPLPSRRLIL